MKSTKQTQSSPNLLHNILGAVLVVFIVLLCGAIVYVNSRATVTTQVTVSNAAPSITAIHVNQVSTASTSDAASVNVSPGTTANVYINGTVSDPNGYGDIDQVNGSFYRYGADCPGTPNDNNCYVVPTVCTLSGGSGNTINYSCTLPIQYFADSTDAGGSYPDDDVVNTPPQHGWIATVRVVDLSDSQAFASTYTEVNTQVSLTFPTLIDFLTLSPGTSTTTGNNVTTAITQAGNAEADMTLSGTDMTCTSGSIDLNHQEYSTNSANVGYGGTGATKIPFATSSPFLDVKLHGVTGDSKNIHWNISIPTGVSGTCSGTLTMSAQAH